MSGNLSKMTENAWVLRISKLIVVYIAKVQSSLLQLSSNNKINIVSSESTSYLALSNGIPFA